ncbi:MAG TPA: hypothetical protein VFH27_18525 [Longimicrobiaceae bacterium]|nr:hypothetical protein [Longimicrobiaceae bacterium]
MNDFLFDDAVFPHLLAALVLLSRAGDLVSTWLASPTLRLEANPVVRRLGWSFGLLTLGSAIVPYYNTSLGVMVLTTSFMVTASNLSSGWMMRTLGEAEMSALLDRVARRSSLRSALGFTVGAGAATMAVGLLMVWLCRTTEWGYYFGWGVLAFAVVKIVHGGGYMIRLHRRVDREASAPMAAALSTADLPGASTVPG